MSIFSVSAICRIACFFSAYCVSHCHVGDTGEGVVFACTEGWSLLVGRVKKLYKQ
jgi:hypothetical protein